MKNEVYVVVVKESENRPIPPITVHACIESAMMWMMKFTKIVMLTSCNGSTMKFSGDGAKYEIERYNLQDVPDFYGCLDNES